MSMYMNIRMWVLGCFYKWIRGLLTVLGGSVSGVVHVSKKLRLYYFSVDIGCISIVCKSDNANKTFPLIEQH